jgi:hypothetical protein
MTKTISQYFTYAENLFKSNIKLEKDIWIVNPSIFPFFIQEMFIILEKILK